MSSFRIGHSTNPRGGVPCAMNSVIQPETRLAQRAAGLLAALTWDRPAAAHLPADRRLAELVHA